MAHLLQLTCAVLWVHVVLSCQRYMCSCTMSGMTFEVETNHCFDNIFYPFLQFKVRSTPARLSGVSFTYAWRQKHCSGVLESSNKVSDCAHELVQLLVTLNRPQMSFHILRKKHICCVIKDEKVVASA